MCGLLDEKTLDKFEEAIFNLLIYAKGGFNYYDLVYMPLTQISKLSGLANKRDKDIERQISSELKKKKG